MFPIVGVWKLGVQSERIRGARAGRGKVCAACSELGELGCLEVLRFGIPDVHGTAGKVVVEGVECERACIDAGLDPVVGEQAVDGLQYGAFLTASCADVGGFVGILMLEFFEDGMGEAEPARDVGLLRDDFRVQEAVNAAAVRVSHDDDVAHVEVLHGVFDGGDDRIMFACLLDIGNDRGNASGDEEVARTAPHQNGGVDARVAAGYDERLRILAVDEAAEEFALAEEVVFLEVVEALNQFVKILHGWCTE